MTQGVEIPNRAFFKAAEVCTIAGVQSYVLKSWETEFPSLGSKKRKDGTRIYGRDDVELVLRIKELLFSEGLTLGAARRSLEEEREANEPELDLSFDEVLGEDARKRLIQIKTGLQDVLDILSKNREAVVQSAVDAKAVIEETTGSHRKTTPSTQSRGRSTKEKSKGKQKRRMA
jgi:DNA-binding transcriptional MerR regulator